MFTAPTGRPEDEPTFFCPLCLDETSGWRPLWCPGVGTRRDMVRPEHVHGSLMECGKRDPHGPHAYVDRCECYGHNPVVERRRARQAKRREEQAANQRRRAL